MSKSRARRQRRPTIAAAPDQADGPQAAHALKRPEQVFEPSWQQIEQRKHLLIGLRDIGCPPRQCRQECQRHDKADPVAGPAPVRLLRGGFKRPGRSAHRFIDSRKRPAHSGSVPALVIAARGEESVRVLGLELGAAIS